MATESSPAGELKLKLAPAEASQQLSSDQSQTLSTEGGTPPLLVIEQEKKTPFLPPSAPIREDQVQNAVNFLSHPNVKGSPVKYRRSFLEKKGLTADEIDEAFRRVPDAPTGDAAVDTSSTVSTLPPSTAVQTLRVPSQSSQTVSTRTAAQIPQQYSGQPMGVAPAQLGSGQLYAPVTAQLFPSAPPATPPGMRWTQMILALGVIGAGGAGAALLTKNHFLPWVKEWLRNVVLDGKDAAPTAHAGDVACNDNSVNVEAPAEASTGIAKTSEQSLVKALEANAAELRATLDTLKDAVQALQLSSGGKDSDSHLSVADLRKELRSFAGTLSEFSGQASSGMAGQQVGLKSELAEFRQVLQEALQAGKPKAVEEPVSSSRLGSESNGNGQLIMSPSTASYFPPASQAMRYGSGVGEQVSSQPATGTSNRFDEAPHSKSYLEDIDDKPPDPTRPPSEPQLKPRLKPWERASSTNMSPAASTNKNTNASDSTMWWQKRGGGLSQSPVGGQLSSYVPSATSPQYTVGTAARPPAPSHRVVITEASDVDGHKESGPISNGNTSSHENFLPARSSGQSSGWVPPPVPLPVLPEAAAAIRQQPSEKTEIRGGGGGFSEKQKQSGSVGPEQSPVEDGLYLSEGGGESVPVIEEVSNVGSADFSNEERKDQGNTVTEGPFVDEATAP